MASKARQLADVISSGSILQAGDIAYFAMNTPPTGWLKSNGAEVSRTLYAELFAAIGTTYGEGDGSTTFNLPDLRGEFPRGWDDGRGVDSGRGFGTAQLDQMQRITATYGNDRLRGADGAQVWSGAINRNNSLLFPVGNNFSPDTGSLRSGGFNFDSANSPDARTSTTTDGETRPRNTAMLVCIKY